MSTVALVAPSWGTAFHAAFYYALHEQRFNGTQFAVRSVSNDPDVQSKILGDMLRVNQPDSLIAVSVRPSPVIVTAYRDAGAPIICVDEEAPGCTSITGSNTLGGYMAAEHLLSKGRSRFLVVSGRVTGPGSLNAAERVAGFRRAVADKGGEIVDHIEVTEYSAAEGREILRGRNPNRFDAIFCAAGDTCASGVLAAIAEARLSVPSDISLLGYDDAPIAQQTRPNLTTVRQPLWEMAEEVLRSVTTGRALIVAKPKHLTFTPCLVVRATT